MFGGQAVQASLGPCVVFFSFSAPTPHLCVLRLLAPVLLSFPPGAVDNRFKGLLPDALVSASNPPSTQGTLAQHSAGQPAPQHTVVSLPGTLRVEQGAPLTEV